MLALAAADKAALAQKFKIAAKRGVKPGNKKATKTIKPSWAQAQVQISLHKQRTTIEERGNSSIEASVQPEKLPASVAEQPTRPTRRRRIASPHVAVASVVPSAIPDVTASFFDSAPIAAKASVPAAPLAVSEVVAEEAPVSRGYQPLQGPSVGSVENGKGLRKRVHRVLTPEEWTERHRPKTVMTVLGNQKPKQQLQRWLQNHTKPVLLAGPVGIGKTSLAHALFRDAGFVIKDCRSERGSFASVMENLMLRKSVDGIKVAIIVDEVENMDAGERRSLVSLLKGMSDTTPPVLCICENPSDRCMDAVKRLCTVVRMFHPFNIDQDASMLVRRLVKVEKARLGPEQMNKIVKVANGDLRRATLMTQMAAKQSLVTTGTFDMDVFAASPFDAAGALLRGPLPEPMEALELCRSDTAMVSLLVQENYPRAIGSMEGLVAQAELLSVCDMLDAHPAHQTHHHSTTLGAWGTMVHRTEHRPKLGGKWSLDFTKWLGCQSSRNGHGSSLDRFHRAIGWRWSIPMEDVDFVAERIRVDKPFAKRLLTEYHVPKDDIKAIKQRFVATAKKR